MPPVPLDGFTGRRGISLFLSVYYRLVQESDRWRARINGYRYELLDRDDREILAYHWHPEALGPSFPHVHLTGRLPAIEVGPGFPPVALGELHLPTSRITFAAIARLLIDELGIAPRRSDWDAVLTASAEAERQHQTG